MDKTNEKFQPHKMWKVLRKVNDLLALIGAADENDLPIPIENFQLLNSKCQELLTYSEDFLEYAKDRNNE